MDSEFQFQQRVINRRVIQWDAKFTKRNDIVYPAENTRVVPQDGETRIEAFFTRQSHGLLPSQYSYDALRRFLSKAKVEYLDGTRSLDPTSKDAEKTILLDERKDTTPINKFTSRDWTEYAERPPEGAWPPDAAPKGTTILQTKELFDRLMKDVTFSSQTRLSLSNLISEFPLVQREGACKVEAFRKISQANWIDT